MAEGAARAGDAAGAVGAGLKGAWLAQVAGILPGRRREGAGRALSGVRRAGGARGACGAGAAWRLLDCGLRDHSRDRLRI